MPMILVTEDELYHHGIKGQKWGERNGPPYPLDPKVRKQVLKQQKEQNKQSKKGIRDDSYRSARTIPAGTIMYRTTASSDANANGTTYVTYLEADRNHYKGGWIRQTAGTKQAYEHEFQLKKDLKIPSRDEVKEVVTSAVNKDPKMIAKTADTFLTMLIKNDPYLAMEMSMDKVTGKYSEDAFNKFKTEFIDAFGKMNPNQSFFLSTATLGLNTELKDQVVSELKRRGYNAMVDEASVGGNNGFAKEGLDPLIVFDGADTLYRSKTTRISSLDEAKANSKYQRWVRKARWTSGEWSDHESGTYL
jgi:hypothetical protein